MVNRRKLLTGVLPAGITAGLAAKSAGARIVTGHNETAAHRDDCAFVIDQRAALVEDIVSGAEPAHAERMARCPLCYDVVRITAES